MKKINKKSLCIVFIITGLFCVKAQSNLGLTTLEKITDYYKNTPFYDLKVDYSMYKGLNGNNITETYSGTIYKNKEVYMIDILGSKIIQFTDNQLIVNDEDQSITYSKIANSTLQNSPVDIKKFLTLYEINNTSNLGKLIIVELVLKKNNLQIPYNKITLFVNKDTYALEKQELYFSTKLPFADKEGKQTEDFGKMVITFQPNSNPLKEVPKLEDYIELTPTIQLVKAYKKFTLIDQTKNK